MNRKTTLIIHCSQSPEGRPDTRDDIDRWHREKGWSAIGYHYVIGIKGEVWKGRDLDGDGDVLDETGAHALGYNRASIGLCYIGGADANGNPKDTRTFMQDVEMQALVRKLIREHGITKVIGHNEVSSKDCPCFDVQQWLQHVGIADELA